MGWWGVPWPVDAVAVYGQYAVHRGMLISEPPGWAVTHVPSGCPILYREDRQSAETCAIDLHQEVPDVLHWLQFAPLTVCRHSPDFLELASAVAEIGGAWCL